VTPEPRFLPIDRVIQIHTRMIMEYGGTDGISDRGLLESAVAMPGAGIEGVYLHPSLPAMAGAYLFHLCMDHPFVDGNKRVAVTAADIFLNINRLRVTASDEDLLEMTSAVASGQMSKADVILFYENHAEPI
jgi:death-on-curing protein